MIEELHDKIYRRKNAFLEIITISKGCVWAQRITEFFHDSDRKFGALDGYEYYDHGFRSQILFKMSLDDEIKVDIFDVNRNTFWNNWLKRKNIYRPNYPEITNSPGRKLFLELNKMYFHK